MTLSGIVPEANDPVGRRWKTAITSALKAGVRHTPQCHAAGRFEAACAAPRTPTLRPDCPWCAHILETLR